MMMFANIFFKTIFSNFEIIAVNDSHYLSKYAFVKIALLFTQKDNFYGQTF